MHIQARPYSAPVKRASLAALAIALLAPALAWWVISGTPVSTAAGGASWTTYQHDNARSGVDSTQPTVTSVVSPPWSVTLDALIFAQPLVVGSSVIVGTSNNSVYAFDVNTHQQLWQRSVGSAVTSGLPGGCGDPAGTPGDPVGILGTPVADAAAGILYVASLNQAGPGALQYFLTAINLNNGAINYSVPINLGGGFDASVQDQRAALTLSQGRVYVAFGGLAGDCGTYHGWVWSGLAANGSGGLTYQVPTAARGGGIWSPAGGSVDASGNLYVATGNSFQESTPDHSESVISLSPTLQENSFWRAADWSGLNNGDIDLGSFGPLQLNNSQFSQYNGLIFQSGKNGQGYLLQASNLSAPPLFSAGVCGAEVMGGAAYVPPFIYVGCTRELTEIRLSTSGSPSFTSTTLVSGYTGNTASGATTPIFSGGMVWNLDVGARHLVMVNPSTTPAQVETFNLTGQPVHFASPSSGAGTIFVPAGRDLDGFVLNSQGGGPTSTPTSTPTSASAATATPTPTPTATSQSTGGTQTITFDDLTNTGSTLNGQYPAGVIDWGTNNWWLAGAYGGDPTNSISFNGAAPTSEAFAFVSPRRLLQLQAINGGNTASTVGLTCAGQPPVQMVVYPGQIATINTGWTASCTPVSVSSSNGWATNFDNLVIDTGSGAGQPTSTPTPTPTAPPTNSPTPTNTPTPTPTPVPSGGGNPPGGGSGPPSGGGSPPAGGGGGGGSHTGGGGGGTSVNLGGGGGGGGGASPALSVPSVPAPASNTQALVPLPASGAAAVQTVSLDAALSVSFPGDFHVTTQVVSPDQVPSPPPGFQLGAHIVEIAASTGDSDLPAPVTLEYQVDPADLSAADGVLEHVHLAALQGSDWVALPCASGDQGVLNCALTHLSTFAVLIAPTPAGPLDFDLPDGAHFFKQANGWSGAGDSGYSVRDDDNAAFWTELQRLGGVDGVGYPISNRFIYQGLWTQAFQKQVLQWHSDLAQAQPINLLDDLNARGLDTWLDSQQAIPPAADTSPDVGLSFDAVVTRHVAVLDAYAPLQSFYLSTPDAVGTFGLPLSVKDYGPVVSVRTQRAILQLWPNGSVTVGNAGDAAKAAGLFPRSAITPEISS